MADSGHQPPFLSSNDLRLVLFGGKGGVGKTSCAVATALHIARTDPTKSVTLVSTDPAHSLLDSLATTSLPPNLEVIELDASACLERFLAAHGQRFREIAERGTFFDRDDIDRILALTLPGMDELMAFLELGSRLGDEPDRLFIVDTAPTGHALRLIGMTDLMERWLSALDALLAKSRYMRQVFQSVGRRPSRHAPAKDDLDRFLEKMAQDVVTMRLLLQDPSRSSFVPVMLAETASLEETFDLVKELSRFGIRYPDIVVNRLYPENDCLLCASTRSRQLSVLTRLDTQHAALSGVRFWGVPMFSDEVTGEAALFSFWQAAHRLDPSGAEAGRASLTPSIPDVWHPLSPPGSPMSLLILAGKGGVGKTSMACATAFAMAKLRPESRILLFSADPAHSIADCLAMPVGAEPTPVSQGVWAMEMDAAAEYAQLVNLYQEEVRGLLTTIMPGMDLAYDSEALEKLMDLSPPGIDELMALTRVMELLSEGRFDLLVLDTAPTGHLIRLLELPTTVEAWLKTVFGLLLKYRNLFRLPAVSERLIRISRELKHLRSLIHDASRSSLLAVTIPTRMALAETDDLLDACARMTTPVGAVILNLVTPETADPFCTALRDRESEIRKHYGDSYRGVPVTTVFRSVDLQGWESLSTLGARLIVSDPAAPSPMASGSSGSPDAAPEKESP